MKQIFSFLKNTESEDLSSITNQFSVLQDSARVLYMQSESLKKLVTDVKRSIERSSSASHEISSTVATTADAAADLEKTANDSFEAMERSTTARNASSALMEDVVSSVEELQESVKKGLSEIASIATTMSQIQQKAKVINEIVFQTKLLSFNASVEAARAGEYGKGFSVVADEMAKLAALSGSASKEIEEIIVSGINQTQSQIKSVTDNLNQAAAKTSLAIKNENSKRSEVTAIFAELVHSSQLTNEKSQQISTATKEQDLGVKEINSALQQLESNSIQLEQMASDNHNSSIKLSELVEGLTQKIDKFAQAKGISISKQTTTFDFSAAIKAHIDWKMKLGNYLNNPDGSLDSKKVCLDNACVLGKWLYGDGVAYNHHPLYNQVRESHASFHKIAGRIIEHIHQGDKEAAEKLLMPHGEYTKISDQTVHLIEELKAKVESE